MKKILYIITQSEFGGAQRYIFDLATHLKSEFKIIVAAGGNSENELFQRLKAQNIASREVKYLKRNINPIYDLLAFFELRQLIRKEKPNIIHLNSSKAGILGSLALSANQRPKPKIIYTVHGWVFNEPLNWLKKKIYLWLEKATAKLKTKIICLSTCDRQIAAQKNFPEKILAVINNGINSNSLKFLSKEKARQKLLDKIGASFKQKISNPKIIGAIANLYPAKGIKYLIESANILNAQSQIPNTIFIVIGDGAERAKLEALIKKYNLENKFFLAGQIPSAYQYLKSFDLFVLPSVKEGFPYAILEAMIAGQPIIATEVGGIPEMIKNKKAGLLVQPKNSQELAEKILYILNEQASAEELGKQAEKRVKQKFSLEKMIRKTKEVYLF